MKKKEAWQAKFSLLDKRIKSFLKGYHQNLALLGDDSEEISYLLDSYFQSNKPVEAILIRLNPSYLNKGNFFKAAVSSLLSESISQADTLDNLINSTGSTLNVTMNFIKDVLKKNNFSFLDVLEVINKFINESKTRCVFIIEEFLELTKLFPNLYEDFSKFIILQRNCMVILTSSFPRDAEKVLFTELNLLFGNFEKIFLDENVFLDSYTYLKDSLLPLAPSPLLVSFFVNIMGSNIIYYDLISDCIKANWHKDEVQTIIYTLEKSFYSEQTYFFQKFLKKISLLKAIYRDFYSMVKILIFLSQSYIRKKELADLAICDYKELGANLTKLIELNYIENLGNIYKIKDSLFSFWLSCVFDLRFFSPVLNSDKRKLLWGKRIEEEISIFKENFFKDKTEKVLELISSFKDDTLRIGKTRYRLPRIDKTEVISPAQGGFRLLVGEGKEIIFVGIKEEESRDNDIIEFIERGSGLKGKKIKKIFISLGELLPTAKLIAKNHKLIIWDINEINYLLQVYHKPIISLENEAVRAKLAVTLPQTEGFIAS